MKRLPELFCGFPRLPGQGPTAYPVACLPQAWASASAFAVLGALLGVTFRPGQRQIRFIRPVLPPWLEVVRIENLRLGSTAADLELRRHDGGEVSLTVLGRHGAVEVAVIS
jgi:glycogen debranching enzyme